MAILTFDENRRIYYERIKGRSNAPFLVFLHEGLGCTAMWKGFPKRLCQITGCPGLVYDRLGYGKSSALTSIRTIHYLHDYGLNELPRIIKKLIPKLPFVLIGHSDGGSIALIYGAEKPALLLGIITEAAHIFVEPETVRGIRRTLELFEEGKLNGLNKYHGGKTEGIFRAWSDTWSSDWFRHWNIEYLLPSIECPSLIIQGKNDTYATEEHVHAIVSQTAGQSEAYFVPNCGHSPHGEKQKEVLQKMSFFVQGLCDG